MVAELARAGFDGVYLDWVEAYSVETVAAAADAEGVDGQEAMLQFVEAISAAGRLVDHDFLVVVQNAPYLIDLDPERYTAAVDGLAVEDTWFRGEGDAPWDDRAAGDLPADLGEGETVEDRLAQYGRYRDHGLPVFTVDYCVSEENAAFVYDEARAHDLVPLVTRVALSRMTETPPRPP